MNRFNRRAYAVMGVLMLLMAGFIYAWSVMASFINKELNIAQGSLSITFTLVMITFCLGGLLGGILGKKTKVINLLVPATLMLSMGLLIASYTKGVALLYIGFGIISGLGSGIIYNVVMSNMSKWYPDKQGLISGIMLMGFGLSSFIVGKVFAAMSLGSDTSWRTTFKIFAIASFILMAVLSVLFKGPAEDYKVEGGTSKKKEPALELTPKEMIKKPAFIFYYLWAILTTGAGLTIVSQASGIVTEASESISAGTVATIVGLLAITNGLGRVIFGALFDKIKTNTVMTIDIMTFFLAGLSLLLYIKFHMMILGIAGFVFCGLAYGAVPTINSAIISDFFGRKNFAVNYSITNTNLIIASFASTIAGKVFDSYGSYKYVALVMLIYTFASLFAQIPVKRPKGE
ncbi:MAG: MFS transporter [Lachnospiraceae bacterium]|nr:MFS transporter [Lachnospiraceae bacterium]